MLYIPFPFKRCTKCGKYKSATTAEFYVEKRHKNGLHSICHLCMRERGQRYYENNADKIRDKNSRWWANHPGKPVEYSRQYRELNPDKVRKAVRRWQKKNPEKAHEATRRWQQENPDKVRAGSQKRRVNKRELPATFTNKHWRAALEYFHHVCAYCGNGVSLFDRYYLLQQDHFIPVNSGGGYTPDNIVPACQSCNTSKNDSDPHQWTVRRYGKRKAKVILARIETYFETITETH